MNKKLVLLMTWVIALIGMLVQAAVSAEISVGVKEGDWIEYKMTYIGTPPEKHLTRGKIEILSVQGTTVTFNSTGTYFDGTQETETNIVDLETGVQAAFIVPANLSNGDTFHSGDEAVGYITISGVEERTYAGGRRIIVHATVLQVELYWDKATGVLVEGSSTEVATVNLKADKTNMWQAEFLLPIDPTLLSVLIIVAIVIVVAVVFFVISRRKK